MKTLRQVSAPGLFQKQPFQKNETTLPMVIMDRLSLQMFEEILSLTESARDSVTVQEIGTLVDASAPPAAASRLALTLKPVADGLRHSLLQAFYAARAAQGEGILFDNEWGESRLIGELNETRERYLAASERGIKKAIEKEFSPEKIKKIIGLAQDQIGTLIKFNEHSSEKDNVKTSEDDFIEILVEDRVWRFSRDSLHNFASLGGIAAMKTPDNSWFKTWVTAADERVCPRCGVMHGEVVPVHKTFSSPVGDILYPSAIHPKCRCWVEFHRG